MNNRSSVVSTVAYTIVLLHDGLLVLYEYEFSLPVPYVDVD
jgi:hypothetical protein